MIRSHHDIESIDGFMDWFAGGQATSRGEPASVVDVEGIGCTFSRSLNEGERAAILDYLRAHADKHKKLKVIGRLSAPLAEISGARIDEVRAAVRELQTASGSLYTPHMESMVVLAFGARRDTAEQKRKELGPRIYARTILEEDGAFFLVGSLLIPLDQHSATVAEIDQYFKATRKEIGSTELDQPPVFIAELTLNCSGREDAESVRARLGAVGLTIELVEEVASSGHWEARRWQIRWMVKSGRVEEVMRPGVLSERGFLGDEERLDEVLKEDASTLVSLGVTAADIADRLRQVVGEAIRRERDGRISDRYAIGKFLVRLEQWGGFQQCPWLCEDEPSWSSIDFVIENRRSGAKLAGPGLIVHLIAEHGFFEGAGSPYRVDPRQAAAVLDLPRGWWDRLWQR